jgi:CelD/BcsL family acetyltransferase involved in cellulose biosynthesis
MDRLAASSSLLVKADASTDTAECNDAAALDSAAHLPATAHISLTTTLQGLLALEAGWRALEKNACTPTSVFQSFDWISAWCRTYCTGDAPQDLHIITGYDRDRLVFVWPLMVQRRMGLRVLCWLTEPFGQYGDVVCAQHECPRLWVANALRFLKRLKGIDMLRLRHVRDDSTLKSVASKELVDAKLNERAPYLDLTAFASEADYENRYTGAQRKRRKKIRKHLEEMGPVTFVRLPLGSESEAAITNALAEKNKWLAERGRINRVLGCPGHLTFLKTLSRSVPQGLDMVVTELRAGDRPVSWEISFRYGSTHFAYITSHVCALTDLSPGRLHFDHSQRDCLAAGIKTFDLMVPYDSHKESWSSGCMPTQDYFLPLTFAGRIAGNIYLRQIRPALRSVYYRLPQSVLRLINPSRGRATEQ